MNKAERVMLIRQVLNEMYADAYCELYHTNNLELVIAVLLSAQTTDAAVNKLTAKLFLKYKTLEDYLSVSLSELESDLKTIGLYKNKAKSIQGLCTLLKDRYQGIVPSTRKDLESLPGVGRKTANVVLSVAFNIPAFAVDTHVERVSKRLALAKPQDSVLQVEKKLMRSFKRDEWNHLHHQFIFFGRYHCKAIRPECPSCPVINICKEKNKTI